MLNKFIDWLNNEEYGLNDREMNVLKYKYYIDENSKVKCRRDLDTVDLLKCKITEKGYSKASIGRLLISACCKLRKISRDELTEKNNNKEKTAEIIRCFLQEQLPLHQSSQSYIEKTFLSTKDLDFLVKIDRTDSKEKDKGHFYGRQSELGLICKHIVEDRCRVISVQAMGGVGKTSLIIEVDKKIANEFQCIIWQELSNCPPINQTLRNILNFISCSKEDGLGKDISENIDSILTYLHGYRCLIVLDNMESVMNTGNKLGDFTDEYQSYNDFIDRIAREEHESCLIVTSRENPDIIQRKSGDNNFVFSIPLEGLGAEAIAIIDSKNLDGTQEQKETLVKLCSGNPLILDSVCALIDTEHDHKIQPFLTEAFAKGTIYNGADKILSEHFNRLSIEERATIFWMAIKREPATSEEISNDFYPSINKGHVIQFVNKLRRRSLVKKILPMSRILLADEISPTNKPIVKFSLENVVIEYITDTLIEELKKEVSNSSFNLFKSHALIQATSRDYIRDTQSRLILNRVKDRIYGSLKKFAAKIIVEAKSDIQNSGYMAGNVINILTANKENISGYDLSELLIQQAYFADTELKNVNMSNCDLRRCVFKMSMFPILSCRFSQDSRFLASGDDKGSISIWEIKEQKRLDHVNVHLNGVISLLFKNQINSKDLILISAGNDGIIKFGKINQDGKYQNLSTPIVVENNCEIHSAAITANGNFLAIGISTGSLEIWDVENIDKRIRLHNLTLAHAKRITSTIFTPDNQKLLTASSDKTVKVWDVKTCNLQQTLELSEIPSCLWIEVNNSRLFIGYEKTISSEHVSIGVYSLSYKNEFQQLYVQEQAHKGKITSIVSSPDGKFLYTAGIDTEIAIWKINENATISLIDRLRNRDAVYSLAIDEISGQIASTSQDCSVRIWKTEDTSKVECMFSSQGYSGCIYQTKFVPNNQNTLISTSNENEIRIWDVESGTNTELSGHSGEINSIVFSPTDSNIFASGSYDTTIKIWNLKKKQSVPLDGHNSRVWALAFSSDGKMLISGSYDGTIKLWDIASYSYKSTLMTCTSHIYSLAFHPSQSNILAVGISHSTVYIWNLDNSSHQTFENSERSWVASLLFSPDGKILITGDGEGKIRLWDVDNQYTLLETYQDHQRQIFSLTLSPDSSVLASSSDDKTVILWDIDLLSKLLRRKSVLEGHDNGVRSVTFSPDGKTIATGGIDNTIRHWDLADVDTKAKIYEEKLWRAYSPYEDLDITDTRGLNESEKLNLKMLGAKYL
jgi:WD40 repeat protein